MKKLTLGLLTACLFILIIPVLAKAETDTTPVAVVATNPAATVDVSALFARVETIKAMDFSTLNSSEKKELRKELRTIKTDLKKSNKRNVVVSHANGGVYLSVGAIIVIVIILILIL
jgi:hypothetical protein